METIWGTRARAARSTFLRDSGTLTAAGLATAVIVVVQGILVARWLGPAGYGVVALVSVYPAIAVALLSPDSPHATIRYLADRDAAGDPLGALCVCKVAHTVDAAISLLAFLAVAATAPWAARHVVHMDAAAGLLVLTAAAFVVASPLEAAAAVLMHTRRFRLLATEQVGAAAVRSALVIAAVAAGGGAAGAVRAAALATVVHGVVLASLAAREAKREWGAWWPGARTTTLGPLRGELLRFMIWTDLGGALGTATKQLDVVLLGWVSGPAEVGLYRLARSIASLPGYVVGPLQTAAYPRLARQWAESGRARLREVLRPHAVLGVALAGAGLAGVGALPVVVRLLVGAQYAPAVGTAQVLLVGSLVWVGLYWLRPAFMAVGEVRAWVTISAVVVAGSSAAFVPAAVAWGAMGLALVQLAAAITGHAAALRRLRPLLAQPPAAGMLDRVSVAQP